MKKICTIVGARPQFIKAATLTRHLEKSNEFCEVMIHTGQHYDADMSDIFFRELNIPTPKYNLELNGGTHSVMTGKMLEEIEKILIAERPTAVLIYGDTNTTVAGAIAAAKLNIPLIHIEAGLRSKNMHMPEELNRIVADKVSNVLCCPTSTAVHNLACEGITEGVHLTGDVMYDATLFALDQIKNDITKYKHITALPPFALLTIHRAESTANIANLQKILNYVMDFAKRENLHIIFPVHPRTQQLLKDVTIPGDAPLQIIAPIGYLETQAYLAHAKYALTDSGGLQKEAYFHRVPCVTLRTETEWVETISHGWNRLWTEESYAARRDIAEYGEGHAAKIINDLLVKQFV